MAVINYEPLDSTDATTTKTLLYEAIPLTGTIVSGTYGVWPDDSNIKNYSHGMFQSVYDYPYLSSSANHIFDVTVGYNKSSTLSGSTVTLGSKKINMYNQFSQVLLGYTGSKNTVRDFELDLKLDQTGSMKEAVFVNFSRLLTKDQVKKGSFSITIGTGTFAQAFHGGGKTLTDASASDTQGTANTLGGDYGVLFDSMNTASGLVFYQAGIVVLATGAKMRLSLDWPKFRFGKVARFLAVVALPAQLVLPLSHLRSPAPLAPSGTEFKTSLSTTRRRSTLRFTSVGFHTINIIIPLIRRIFQRARLELRILLPILL